MVKDYYIEKLKEFIKTYIVTAKYTHTQKEKQKLYLFNLDHLRRQQLKL